MPYLLNKLQEIDYDEVDNVRCYQCMPVLETLKEDDKKTVVSTVTEEAETTAGESGPEGSDSDGKNNADLEEDEEFEDEGEATIQGRNLEAEARSVQHMLTHSHRNPYCKICREAVINNKAKKRDAVNDLREKLTRFGECIDGDHLITANDGWEKALDGSKVGLVLHDLFSGFTDLYPKKSKGSTESYEAMNDFADGQWVNSFYSDRSPELVQAAKWLGWNHAKAHQGMPRTNPVAERQVQRVSRGLRKILSAAGLPNKFWGLAARYWCFMDNIDCVTGDSRFNRRVGLGQWK